jgi:hypothetical protein
MNKVGTIAVGAAAAVGIAAVVAAAVHHNSDSAPETTAPKSSDAKTGAELATRPNAGSNADDPVTYGGLSSTTIGVLSVFLLAGAGGSY